MCRIHSVSSRDHGHYLFIYWAVLLPQHKLSAEQTTQTWNLHGLWLYDSRLYISETTRKKDFAQKFRFSEPLERICRIVGTLIETVSNFPTTFTTYTQVWKSYCSGNGNICSTLYRIARIYVRFREICIIVFSKLLLKYPAFTIIILSVFNLYVKSHDVLKFWSEK
jgi:hypothetical protein